MARVKIQQLIEQGRWELLHFICAFQRRFGLIGLVIIVGVMITTVSWVIYLQQANVLKQIYSSHSKNSNLTYKYQQVEGSDSRAQLQAFENFLIPHEQIPDVVQSLMSLASSVHLVLVRGEYKQQSDVQGGFMRYQMSLPVKGEAQAIYRFISLALKKHQTLALNNVQFKRAGIESKEVEAQIQWVLFTHLPGDSANNRALNSFVESDYDVGQQ